jgi:hypothetical protein
MTVYGPEITQALAEARRIALPSRPFALITSLPRTEKPTGFQTLDALAARIHKLRRGAALSHDDVNLTFKGQAAARRAVAVYTQDEGGTRDSFIGYAWLNGQSWSSLSAALYAIEPNSSERAEAA